MRLKGKVFMNYPDQIERLTELVNEEHVCGCDDYYGCDVNFAYSQGFYLWSIELFSSSGASSNEFNKIYKKLPKKFFKQAEAERKAMCKEDHAMCPNCNTVMWQFQDLLNENGEMHCTSCAGEFLH